MTTGSGSFVSHETVELEAGEEAPFDTADEVVWLSAVFNKP